MSLPLVTTLDTVDGWRVVSVLGIVTASPDDPLREHEVADLGRLHTAAAAAGYQRDRPWDGGTPLEYARLVDLGR